MDEEKVYVIKNDKGEYHDGNGKWTPDKKKAQQYPSKGWDYAAWAELFHKTMEGNLRSLQINDSSARKVRLVKREWQVWNNLHQLCAFRFVKDHYEYEGSKETAKKLAETLGKEWPKLMYAVVKKGSPCPFPITVEVPKEERKEWGLWVVGDENNQPQGRWASYTNFEPCSTLEQAKTHKEWADKGPWKGKIITTVLHKDDPRPTVEVWGLLRVPITKYGVGRMIDLAQNPWSDGKEGNGSPLKFYSKAAAEKHVEDNFYESIDRIFLPHPLPKELW